jgi:uncharacterized protein YjbI with pentapeptide repeats
VIHGVPHHVRERAPERAQALGRHAELAGLGDELDLALPEPTRERTRLLADLLEALRRRLPAPLAEPGQDELARLAAPVTITFGNGSQADAIASADRGGIRDLIADGTLTRADLSRAVFRGSQLATAALDGARFEEADFRSFPGHGNMIEHAEFFGCALSNADFGDAVLEGVSFEGCRLAGADFHGSRQNRTVFRGADLTGAHFTDAEIAWAEFEGATLTGAILSRTRFHRVSFDDMPLREARIDRTVFLMCELRRVDLSGLDLTDVDLTDDGGADDAAS